jgi:hypothetical protein
MDNRYMVPKEENIVSKTHIHEEFSNYIDKAVAIFSTQFAINPVGSDSISFQKGLKNKRAGAILNQVDIDNLEL